MVLYKTSVRREGFRMTRARLDQTLLGDQMTILPHDSCSVSSLITVRAELHPDVLTFNSDPRVTRRVSVFTLVM